MVDNVSTVTNIAALRALNVLQSPIQVLWVQGYYSGADGGEGMFWYNQNDTTSSDNGGTIIKDLGNRRWYRELEGRPVTAAQFGAKGDNSTNDHPQLSAMISWLAGQGGGIALLQPNKKYLLLSTLNIVGSSIELWGSGASTWIVNGTTSSPAIQFGDGISWYYRCAIRNLAFGQASGTTPSAGNCGISCNKLSLITLSNITVFNFPAPLYQGLVFAGCDLFYIDEADVQECLDTGIVFYTSTDLRVTNCYSSGNGMHGFYFDGSSNGKFANCEAYNNSGSGWVLDSVNQSGLGVQFHMTNCTGDTSGSHNWIVKRCTEAWFDSCWGSTQKSKTVNTGATGFHLFGSGVTNVTFSGGGAFFNNGAGVLLEDLGGSPTNVYFMGFIAGTSIPAVGNGQSGTAVGFDIGAGTAVQIIGGGATGNAGGALYNGIGSQLTVLALNGYS